MKEKRKDPEYLKNRQEHARKKYIKLKNDPAKYSIYLEKQKVRHALLKIKRGDDIKEERKQHSNVNKYDKKKRARELYYIKKGITDQQELERLLN